MQPPEWFNNTMWLLFAAVVLVCAGSIIGLVYALARNEVRRLMESDDSKLSAIALIELDWICHVTGKSRDEALRYVINYYHVNELDQLGSEAQKDGFYALSPPRAREAEDAALKNKDKSPIEPA